ncbi:MAG TPA: biosynthetic peptidoglycan transglycosylase, partial [Myxococcota bacterium]|nr:biosynthetic peptidoglycan transglycosylase [Myxococcota bacterium]
WSLDLPATPLDALGPLARRLHLGPRGTIGVVLGARQTATRLELDFDLTVEGVTFDHPSVASAPIPDIHARIEGRLIFDATAQELSVRDLVVRSGQLAVTGELDLVSAFGAPRIRLSLDLPETALSDVVAGIPVGLIPLLSGLRMDGRLAWQLSIDLDTTDPAAVKVESRPNATGVRVLSLGDRLDLSALRTAHTYTIRLFDGTPGTRVVGPATASWVPLSQITPYLPLALTTTEDGTFYTNDGISTFAMRESIATNLERGSFVRGASTITQQLVKNLFLGGDKTVSRKLQEVFIAWQLAQLLSKDEIMALYLNTIEFGPGIYGIGDASWHWFGKRPLDLTLAEAVFLASIVPGPRRYYTFYEQGGITPRWVSYLEALMKVMVERKKITAEELAMNLPVQVRFRGHGGGYTDEVPADFDLVPERDGLNDPELPLRDPELPLRDPAPEPTEEDP